MFKWLFKKKGCAKHMNNKLEVMATYCKYFLSCVFEAVTMALAIVVWDVHKHLWKHRVVLPLFHMP